MFSGYPYRHGYSQPSFEERYYRQLAEEQNRRAAAAQRLAQQERERAAREREIQAMRERQHQEEMARQAYLRQQQGDRRRPQSQFFGNPDFESPFDMFGGGFHPRARPTQERPRRESHPQQDRFSTFLDQFFRHEDQEADEDGDVPVPKKARFDRSPSPSVAAEPKARSPSPAATPQQTQETATPAEPFTAAAQPSETPAPGSPKNHSASFTLLDNIQSQFDALRAGFSFPTNVEFHSPAGTPKLTYASVNAPVHQYENELIKLLTKLDAIESDGAASIRGARKALVLAVEKELDRVEESKRDAWKKTLPVEVVEAPAASEHSDSFREEAAPIQETEEPVVAEAAEDPIAAAVSTPLPEADDMELDAAPEAKHEGVAEGVVASEIPQSATTSTTLSNDPTTDANSSTTEMQPEADLYANYANTPEAVADDAVSESESEASSVEAALLVDDEDADPFVQVEKSPSDAVMEKGDVAEKLEVKAPAVIETEGEDDFEML